jgi:hypothetical protein
VVVVRLIWAAPGELGSERHIRESQILLVPVTVTHARKTRCLFTFDAAASNMAGLHLLT